MQRGSTIKSRKQLREAERAEAKHGIYEAANLQALVTYFLEWGRLREAGFTEQRTPPALDGKKNTPESHNSLSSDTLINTWELMNGHDEDWIHLHSKPKHPLWKHLAEESFLSGLDPRILKESVIFLQTTWQKHQTEDNNNKIVLYFTSLRGIRKTYEDCCFVWAVLRGFRVGVEERDILMDSDYRTELQISLGEEKPI
ncbi:hypothetical protein F2Q70_00024424 [Brassica cretica]|uniref:Glutaredoxin domain-containing protein n=1 Tax=Brassica cretica TaxID=69181 RepID=A0A8S9L942_BRACR|nr:hypothetical protein F2Q70_00024424 [Brassica cretica]